MRPSAVRMLAALALTLGLLTPMLNAQLAPPERLKLREVPFTQVEIKDAFWSPRRETNRKVSLVHSLDMLEKSGNLRNFDLAARNERAGYSGPVFMDSDLYKAIESVSYSLATDPDPALESRLDDIIARIAAAQRENGYLNTWYEVNAPDKTFTNLRDHHELYCAGHLFEAAAAHFQATKKRSLLDVASKYADHIGSTFGPGKRLGYCGHPEIELALVKLANVTGEKRYFELAKFFVESRGQKFFAQEHGTPVAEYNGEYWQDNCPIREHATIVGHAVRAAYLMSGCVDVAANRFRTEADDLDLLRMVNRVWRNTTDRNMYVTGGIGPSAHNEGFTVDYDLPNASAYQETCASVAMAMWNHRLNLLYGDAKYADLVETALYNGILSGVSLDGKKFFYVNPLASSGTHHRSDWFGCACCPPNATRTLAALGNYAFAANDSGLWVNLYVQGKVKAAIVSREFIVDVTTDYPWDGHVRLVITPEAEQKAALHLRVPGWCRGARATVNGLSDANTTVDRGYLVLDRAWRAGDVVELELPMPVRRIEANPLVEADRGCVAIARGPIVYCLEACDNDVPLDQLSLPIEASFSMTRRQDLLGGIVTISGEGVAASGREWTGGLYRDVQPARRYRFTAIPYYAWDNREAGEMRVWIPTAPPLAAVGGPERSAKVSMSFVSRNAQPEGIHDSMEPKSSGEQPKACCHWWPHKGGTEWAAYAWDSARSVSGVRVYWFDDTGRGECRVPAAWRVLAKVGEEWKPVETKDAYLVKKDQWCEVRFSAIETKALRLEVTMQEGWAAGVHEWKVIEEEGW